MRARRTPLLLLLLVLACTPAPARADAPRPATPQLIDAALAAGTIDEDEATVLRAQALHDDPALPAAYRSTAPWEGTPTLVQVRAGLPDLTRAERTVASAAAELTVAGATRCGDASSGPLPDRTTTEHFLVDSGTVADGLTPADYADALETAWTRQVTEDGWAAPPTALGTGGRVHVRVDDLGDGGLLGYVTNDGTYGSLYGTDNPNTPWDDQSAVPSCMVLNSRFAALPFGSGPGLLSSTSAHELNHVLQYGYGAIDPDIAPDTALFEGGATFMEQDSQADDTALGHPFPDPTQSLGAYADGLDPYSAFYVLRGLAERFGVGVAGGEEQVLQDFWETLSRRTHGGQMGALRHALALRGTTLGAAFHDYAIAAQYLVPCGGTVPAGRCWTDAARYRAHPWGQAGRAGQGEATAAAPYTGAVADDDALNWIRLPAAAGPYAVTLANTDTGGALRATATCAQLGGIRDMGTLAPLPAGAQGTLTIDPGPCSSQPMLVVTNEASPSDGNPSSSALRSYRVAVGATTACVTACVTSRPASTPPAVTTPVAVPTALTARAAALGAAVRVRATVLGTPTASAVARRGLRVRVTSPLTARVAATLTVDAPLARRLGLAVRDGRGVAGSGRVTSGPHGRAFVVTATGRAARGARALRGARVVVALRVTRTGRVPGTVRLVVRLR